MRNFFFVLLFFSKITIAQDSSSLINLTETSIWTYDFSQDSIPLLLILPPQPTVLEYPIIWSPPPPYFGEIPPPWIPYWPQEYPWILTTTCIFGVYVQPACGDTYHDNGQLSSHIECVDSVMHGKAIYYDETGHKTSESTYHTGHQIKSKNYDSRGRITSMYHYDFDYGNHGICIDYDYDNLTKTVTHYDHGIKHGIREEYYDDFITLKEIYKQDVLVERSNYSSEGKIYAHSVFYNGYTIEYKEYTSSGTIIVYEKSDSIGREEIKKFWNEYGDLMYEKNYKDGIPIGTFLDSYDPLTGIKKTTKHENGVAVKSEERKGDLLVGEYFYENGRHKYTVSWFENGDSAWFFKKNIDGKLNYQKSWNENGKVISEYYYESSALIGNGFYTNSDTVFFVEANDYVYDMIPIKRWVIYNGDTIRQDYILNHLNCVFSYNTTKILASNYFIYDVDDREYQRHGQWINYVKNKLESVVTYNFGEREGKAVYYDISKDLPVVSELGYYMSDLRNGQWTTYLGNQKATCDYFNGQKNGNYFLYDSIGQHLCVATYTDDLLNGFYQDYYPDLIIKSTGEYLNGKKTGWWKFYNENGDLILEGEYENDVKIKKWFEYTPSKKGDLEKHKVVYS